VATHGADGIGFVVTKNDDVVGIDLDDCVNPKTGEIEEWALEDIKTINSYTEISPSGEGIRSFAKGNLPEAGRRTASRKSIAYSQNISHPPFQSLRKMSIRSLQAIATALNHIKRLSRLIRIKPY